MGALVVTARAVPWPQGLDLAGQRDRQRLAAHGGAELHREGDPVGWTRAGTSSTASPPGSTARRWRRCRGGRPVVREPAPPGPRNRPGGGRPDAGGCAAPRCRGEEQCLAGPSPAGSVHVMLSVWDCGENYGKVTRNPCRTGRGGREAGKRLLPPARYRHPGDAIRLIIAGLVLAGALAVTAVAATATYAGASAAAITAVAPSTLAGRVLAGLVQALFVAAAVAAVAVTLRHRRFRLLASLVGGAVVASAVVIGIVQLAGGQRPRALAAGAGQWSWLTGASLAGPALGAAAVAGTVAAAPWLSRPWRRTAWITLWLAAAVRLITGTASPMEVVVAFAAGVTAGAGVLVLFGVPDRRIGPRRDRGGAWLRRACRSPASNRPLSRRRARGPSSRPPRTESRCSSRSSDRISGTPTCCTALTGSSGFGTSATPGPPPRSSRPSSTRRSSRSWRSGLGWRCRPSAR